MKPSRRMHEVFNPTFKLIVFCGSQQACHSFASRRNDPNLIIRPAAR